MPSRKKMTPDQIREKLKSFEGWRYEDGRLKTSFDTGNFNAGVELIGKIAKLADELNHHPDVKLTYPRVEIELKTHDSDGITEFDFELARQINQLI